MIGDSVALDPETKIVSGVQLIPAVRRTSPPSALAALRDAVCAELGVEATSFACALMEEGFRRSRVARRGARVACLAILYLEPRVGVRTTCAGRPTREQLLLPALDLVVAALHELDEEGRAALAGLPIEGAQHEGIGRALHTAVRTLAIADRLPPLHASPTALAVAAMAQALLIQPQETLPQRDSLEPPPPSMAEGRSTLAHTSLAQALIAARNRKLTGTLILVGTAGDHHAIVFEQGLPVHARTRRPAQPLGWTLWDLGWIGPEALPGALSRAARSGRKLGAQLVHDGMLTPVRLEEALSRQLAARIGCMSVLAADTLLEFFAGHDLLQGRPDRPTAPCPPEVALLAVTRKMDRDRAQTILERLGDGLIDLHVPVAARMRPTTEEWEVLAKLESLQASPQGLCVDDVLDDRLGLPLVVALTLLGEAHPRVLDCPRCARNA